jgi:hypothetical protein
MASGHVNRTYRPNTWPHRPTLRREDSSCQPGAVHTGAVHTWHEPDLSDQADDIREGLRSIDWKRTTHGHQGQGFERR